MRSAESAASPNAADMFNALAMRISLIDRVADLLKATAAEHVLPYYRTLAEDQIIEKSPGELVTIADREAEGRIARGLADLAPNARFVGEEACAADPSLLDRIGEGDIWIVDPIDGTANFAAGRPPFAIMAALLRDGEILASWIYEPLSGRMAVAERGAGAWIDGIRIRTASAVPERLRGVVSRFSMPEGAAEAAAAVEAGIGEALPNLRCAGDQYPRVATGEQDFALYWRTLVWDHAPGVLLLTEAGGVARRPDGAPYRPAEPGTGMLLAHNEAIAQEIEKLLRGGEYPSIEPAT